jgi:Plasmid pRiA4b ORF-3-like protein
MQTRSLAVLRVTLDDVEPKVMRRIVVPANIRLDRLHLIIQAVMGWTNSHLYEFRIGDAGWGIPDPDGLYESPMDASKTRLDAAFAEAGRKTFSYLYDFGDSWSHAVKVEKITPTIDGAASYLLLDAVGRCPPEDCGGPPGYERLLEILADPDDEEHEEMLTWCRGPFDAKHADLTALQADLERTTRRWAPRSRAAPKPRS